MVLFLLLLRRKTNIKMNKLIFTANMPTPCNGCTERTVWCHSECKKYAEYREQLAALNEKINKAKTFEHEHTAIRYGKVVKMSKSERDARFNKFKQR